jgi:hypothetical protein
MNKSKQPMPKNIRKKMDKTIKKDLKSGDTPTAKKTLTEKEVLAKLPKKMAKIEKDHLLSLEKSLKAKKAKALSKRSKRTNTHEGTVGSEPAHVHPEGLRWIKNIAKQNKVKSKKIVRKMNKIK